MAAVRIEPELSPVQRAVRDAVERLESAHKGPRKFSLRPYELAAGIPNGTLGKLIKGQTRSVTGPTAKKIEALLNIPWQLLTAPEPEPTPPPVTTVRTVVDDEVETMLDAAFDPTKHRALDLMPVRELMMRRAALLDDNGDAVAIVREWLDASARLREKGKERSPEAIFAEVSRQSVERQRLLNERAREESKTRGYEPPAETPASIRNLGKKKH